MNGNDTPQVLTNEGFLWLAKPRTLSWLLVTHQFPAVALASRLGRARWPSSCCRQSVCPDK